MHLKCPFNEMIRLDQFLSHELSPLQKVIHSESHAYSLVNITTQNVYHKFSELRCYRETDESHEYAFVIFAKTKATEKRVWKNQK